MSLYFQESLHVPVHLHSDFLEAWQAEALPAARRIGLEPVGLWKHSSIKGDPGEVIALWQVEGWSHLDRLHAALFDAGSEAHGLGAWYQKSGAWVQQRQGQVLRQRASADALRRFNQPSGRPEFCFHETMHIEPNREHDYVHAMETQLGPSMAALGLGMYGEFQPVFESGRIINLWSVEMGFDAMVSMGQRETDEFLSGGYWMEIGLALRKDWRSVWLLPMGAEF